MGNFTESQILILALIAASNIILIIIAVVLLYSGRKIEKNISKEAILKQEPKKIIEYPMEEKRENKKQEIINVENEAEKQITIEDIEKNNLEDEIDYENYTIPNGQYSDEEYKYASIEEFENAQEETAIISYKELLKLKNQDDNITEEYEEPVMKEASPKNYNNSNYGMGEFISPVFGRVNNTNYEYIKTEPTPIAKKENIRYNNAPIRQEIQRQDSNKEFLNALKEFRRNL